MSFDMQLGIVLGMFAVSIIGLICVGFAAAFYRPLPVPPPWTPPTSMLQTLMAADYLIEDRQSMGPPSSAVGPQDQ